MRRQKANTQISTSEDTMGNINKSMKEYLIFSDESGSWASRNGKRSPPVYLRSWVKIKKQDCEQWDLRYNIDKILRKNKIEVLFTFTCLEEFYTRKFKAREDNVVYIENAISTLEQQAHKGYLKEIPLRVKNVINYVLFLYVYERWHLENALERLWDPSNKYTFIFEKPQFTQRDYKKVIASTKIAGNYKILKANSHIGLKIADRLARFFNKKIIEKLLKKEAIDKRIVDHYKKFILPNLKTAGNCAAGVNKVFLSNRLYLTATEKKLIKDLNELNKPSKPKPKEIVKKPYFKGNPMVWSQTKRKWYVINEDGEWLEFAGKESDIEWEIVK